MVEIIPEGYKQTEVGIIPQDWNVCDVQDAYDICNNLRLPISEQVRKGMQGKYPYYGPTKIQDYINQFRLDGEYALIGEDGDHFLKWSTMPMTLLATGKFNVNNHAHVIRGTINETKWFYWYFYNKDITPVLSRQGAGRYKLNKATLKSIKMTIPPRNEQTAIANALSDVESLIYLIEKLIAKKKNIMQGVMQELLTGEKRLYGFCGEWIKVKLGDISSMCSGGTPNTSISEYYGGNIKWASIKDMSSCSKFLSNTEKTLTQLGFDNCSAVMFEKNTILYAMYASIGECCIANNICCTSQAILGININNKNSVEFIYYKLKQLKEYLKSQGQQGTQSNLNKFIVQNIELIIPATLEEQTAIAQILSDMDNEIEKLNIKLNKYKEIKQGMMQELLTGKRRLIDNN